VSATSLLILATRAALASADPRFNLWRMASFGHY